MFKVLRSVFFAFVTVSAGVYADAGHKHGMAHDVGAPGRLADVTRTIEIEMTENRYNYSGIDVHDGETLRFVIRNSGQLVHEFNIGTPKMHEAHQAEMLEMMRSGAMTAVHVRKQGHGHMKHDDPNSVLINPGESTELIWRFDGKAHDIEFACNVPRHYEAGMVGKFHRRVKHD